MTHVLFCRPIEFLDTVLIDLGLSTIRVERLRRVNTMYDGYELKYKCCVYISVSRQSTNIIRTPSKTSSIFLMESENGAGTIRRYQRR